MQEADGVEEMQAGTQLFFFFSVQDPSHGKDLEWVGLHTHNQNYPHSHTQSPSSQVILDSAELALLTSTIVKGHHSILFKCMD